MKEFAKDFKQIEAGGEFSIKIVDKKVITDGVNNYLIPFILFSKLARESNLKRVLDITISQNGGQYSSPSAIAEKEELVIELLEQIEAIKEQISGKNPQMIDNLSQYFRESVEENRLLTHELKENLIDEVLAKKRSRDLDKVKL